MKDKIIKACNLVLLLFDASLTGVKQIARITFSPFFNSQTLSRHNVLGLAHGKMYKRYTFGASCPLLGTRFGFEKEINNCQNFQNRFYEEYE